MTGHHLTDEQFTELLTGDYPLDASRHMRACPQCQWEFKRVQASIEEFASVGLEWAEKRAAESIPTPSAFARACQPVSSWTAAAAAVLAAAILFGIHREEMQPAPTDVHPAHSESQVADDNRLMMDIDREIHWQADSPVGVDDLAESGRQPHSQASRRLAN
jgi:ferric-dicitrate binding protein FerR (iron transport regulator)